MPKIINIQQHFYQKGSSLLEVMIALFVLGIGLLGTLAMQTEALKLNTNSYAYSQAVLFATDMAERIRANPTAVYALTAAAPPAQTCEPCTTPAELMAHDVYEWRGLVESQLPSGAGTIAVNGDNYTISIIFRNSKNLNDPDVTYAMNVRK